MNIGLTFLQQIQQGPVSLLGGWVYQSFQQMIVAVTKGYHTQHNEDDTHSTITATGSLSERSRTNAMGVWVDVPYSDVVFDGSTATGWSVSSQNYQGLAYMLVGTSLVLAWTFTGTSVMSTPTVLTFTIGTTILPTRTVSGTFHYNNNGTYGTGRCTVAPQPAGMSGLQVSLKLVNLAAWSASTQNTDVVGQMVCEVSGV